MIKTYISLPLVLIVIVGLSFQKKDNIETPISKTNSPKMTNQASQTKTSKQTVNDIQPDQVPKDDQIERCTSYAIDNSTYYCQKCEDGFFADDLEPVDLRSLNSDNSQDQLIKGVQCSPCNPQCTVCDSIINCSACADGFSLKDATFVSISVGAKACVPEMLYKVKIVALVFVIFLLPAILMFIFLGRYRKSMMTTIKVERNFQNVPPQEPIN